MVEQISGGGGLPNIDRNKLNRTQASRSAASATPVSGQDASVSENVELTSPAEPLFDVRSELNSLTSRIEDNLQIISKNQLQQQGSERIGKTLKRVAGLLTDYNAKGNSDDVLAAVNNSFAVEKINIQRTLDQSRFDEKPLIHPAAALDVILNASEISELGSALDDASARVDELLQESKDVLAKQSLELAKSQVAMENLNSSAASQSSGDISSLLRDVSSSIVGDSLDLNRQNIVSILANPSE